MSIIGCTIYSYPPSGCVLTVVTATDAVQCGYCGQTVYPQVAVLRNHDFRWDGSRMTWYSRDFAATVHACASDVETLEEIQVRELTAV